MGTLIYVVICGYPHNIYTLSSLLITEYQLGQWKRWTIIYSIKNAQCWEFLGGPVIKTQGFHSSSPGSIPVGRDEIWEDVQPKKKKI